MEPAQTICPFQTGFSFHQPARKMNHGYIQHCGDYTAMERPLRIEHLIH